MVFPKWLKKLFLYVLIGTKTVSEVLTVLFNSSLCGPQKNNEQRYGIFQYNFPACKMFPRFCCEILRERVGVTILGDQHLASVVFVSPSFFQYFVLDGLC